MQHSRPREYNQRWLGMDICTYGIKSELRARSRLAPPSYTTSRDATFGEPNIFAP